MSLDDRELLGLLFVRQGEREMDQSDREDIDSFELAVRVAPHSAQVFFRIGQIYSKRVCDLNCLALAHEKFAMATKLEPKNATAWKPMLQCCFGLVKVIKKLLILKKLYAVFPHLYNCMSPMNLPQCRCTWV